MLPAHLVDDDDDDDDDDMQLRKIEETKKDLLDFLIKRFSIISIITFRKTNHKGI